MYEIDRDRVVELVDVPQSSVGAPQPIVIADEDRLLVGYYLENRDPSWDGTYVRVIDPETTVELVGVVSFLPYHAMMFGPPNDEAFDGHPLAGRGLRPYGAFEVVASSWIEGLERRNRVHHHHRPEPYAKLRHFILTFHDSTLECVAVGYTTTVRPGPLARVAEWMQQQLRQ